MRVLKGLNCVQREFKNSRICFWVAQHKKINHKKNNSVYRNLFLFLK